MHTYRTLKIVDWRDPQWPEQLVEAADSRRNFVAIFKVPQELDILCARLGCGPPRIPERLLRWGIHALAEVLEPQDYSTLLDVYEQFPVHLVEQLHLTRNHPPACQPFLLYCEVRGIISDHSSLEDAGESLLDYLDSFRRARIFPLAGIYAFRGGRWERVRKLTS